ncbi:endoribonuclease L-PSP [Hesseltinella vesiculosa]|uniref:Endoribonuclease L-PSP n=1 Tax=Hesseltinella vesiculosa TaxID=101127 RepID=A0A1X2GYK4_9FUNG|nr:endoribonuclease L-PSP [Hesseltinella vesiculosa]
MLPRMLARSMSTLSRVQSAKAPAAIGPYAQAIKVNGLVFTSGSLPVDPQSGDVVSGGIQSQTNQSLTNMAEVLKASGSSLKDVVKTTVFLQDMNEFAQMNEVYAKFFAEHQPARSCVQVARLPKDVAVEIECVAVTKN